ncbi:MAG: TIGR02757 family protein [Helicobacteraceae bacterium]|nr:TIGR02757 family protein [Helicobacteraceae bacterium]
MNDLKQRLDKEYEARNTVFELSEDKPDPLFAVKKYLDSKYISEIALICALLSYGNAKQILKTLLSIDFNVIDNREAILNTSFPLYRFQTRDDIKNIFLCMHDIIENGGIKNIFLDSYNKENNVLFGINAMIESLRNRVELTNGLDFLIGRKSIKSSASSPLKRWNMFLRWLVRKDNIDIGIWGDRVSTKHLILPLDTHTFKVSKKLGLLNRKSYDLQSALEITDNLAKFDKDDPIKYDFALYRIGQEKII